MSSSTEAPGLRIAAIRNGTTGGRGIADEWVLIHNDGPLRWPLHEWALVDETPDRDRPREFPFPTRLANAAVWSFEPGESIYLFTGDGRDRFVEPPGERPQFHFYWNREARVWDDPGARVLLRSVDGRFATMPFSIP